MGSRCPGPLPPYAGGQHRRSPAEPQADPGYHLLYHRPSDGPVALSSKRLARPIVLTGDCGRSKSHITAVMHHAIQSLEVVDDWASWLGKWREIRSQASLSLQRGFVAVSEAVHNQEYPYLWGLLFERHPNDQPFRSKFLQSGSPYLPSRY